MSKSGFKKVVSSDHLPVLLPFRITAIAWLFHLYYQSQVLDWILGIFIVILWLYAGSRISKQVECNPFTDEHKSIPDQVEDKK